MNAITEHFYADQNALFDALTAYCQQTLERGYIENHKASLLVSGGSSPAPLYRRLADALLPWQKINVALVDERWVAADSNDANQGFIEKTLLQSHAVSAPFTTMKNGMGPVIPMVSKVKIYLFLRVSSRLRMYLMP